MCLPTPLDEPGNNFDGLRNRKGSLMPPRMLLAQLSAFPAALQPPPQNAYFSSCSLLMPNAGVTTRRS